MVRCKIVILAGGEGMRLRPLTLTRPKPMLPLGPKPVIEHLITQISRFGFHDFLVTVGHLKDQVMSYLGDGSRLGVKVDYAIEPEGSFLGTAGGVKLVSQLLTDTFIVLQGDTYTTIDISSAFTFHRRSKADATIILREVSDPWHYGVVACDATGRIRTFQEKPPKGQEQSHLINTGIYCLDRGVLDLIPSGPCDFARDVFPRLLTDGKRFFGVVGGGAWADVGSLKGYLDSTQLVLEANSSCGDLVIGNNTVIDETARITGPVLIEDDVSIGKDCQLGPYVVLKTGVKIGGTTTIQNATILEQTKIGSQCQISDSIIGEQTTLVNRVIIDSSIVGPRSRLGPLVHVKNGNRVSLT